MVTVRGNDERGRVRTYFSNLSKTADGTHEQEAELPRELQREECDNQNGKRGQEPETQSDRATDQRLGAMPSSAEATSPKGVALQHELEGAREQIRILESNKAQLIGERDTSLQQTRYFKEKLNMAQKQKVQFMIRFELEQERRTKSEQTARDQCECYESQIKSERGQTRQLADQIERQREESIRITTDLETERDHLRNQIKHETALKKSFSEQLCLEREQRNELETELMQQRAKFTELRSEKNSMKLEYEQKLDENRKELSKEKDQRVNAEETIKALTKQLEAASKPVRDPQLTVDSKFSKFVSDLSESFLCGTLLSFSN